MDSLIQESETLDWWNAERFRVDQECRAACDRYVQAALERIDKLSATDLLSRSQARKHVERRLESDMNMFNRRMEKTLRASVEVSMQNIEGAAAFGGPSYGEGAALAAGGAMAFGAVGVAAAAGSIATTTTATAILGLFTTGTVVTFSWPIFSVGAAVALTASYTSPAIFGWATSKLRERFKSHLRDRAERTMIADEPDSVRMQFLERLDQACHRRLAALGERV